MWAPDRIWRLLATGALYVIFGLGSVFFGLFVMLPLAIIFSAARETRVKLWRRVIQLAFAAFVRLARLVGVLEVQFNNAAGLREPGQLIIANHPSLLDVVILISRLPNVDCVIKHGLSRNPFVALQVWMADYIRNDTPEEIVHECARRLDNGRSIIVFPEGTRTRRGQPLKFQRGTARMILASEAPVRPVLVWCHPGSLSKEDPWYRIPEQRIRYRFDVEPCLNIDSLRRRDGPESVRARRLTAFLEEWFAQRLTDAGAAAPASRTRGRLGTSGRVP